MTAPLYSVADRRTSRRSFLLTTSSLAAAAMWSSRALGVVKSSVAMSDYPFQLGVASGDPTADGFVLWTRLAPNPLEGGGMPDETVEVHWQVAEDERMSNVVQSGNTVATPDWAHAVHVEVAGLQPQRTYFYQFKVGSEVSPIGRTKTMPSAGVTPDRLRFAFASCQHFESGYYTAYEHMAKDDLDLVFHLGDYIYEGAGTNKGVRKHIGAEIHSLDDYRNRHAQYKTDTLLQAMHAGAPWMVTWDDHEFDNNYADEISEQPNVQLAAFMERRANAYKAYYEHMPLRNASLPTGPDMQLFRKAQFGNLAEFFVLDTRQYRTDQPNGDGRKAPGEAVMAPQGTILGREQKRWLQEGLVSSTGKWNVLAQQVMVARVDLTPGDEVMHSMDQWPGYEYDRRELLTFLDDRKISNPVVLTGDIHSNWANELLLDFDDLGSKPIATEFVGTSISSGGNGVDAPKNQDKLLSENPFVKFRNAQRGYVRCEVTPKQWKTDYQVIPVVNQPGSQVVTRASFVVESGKPELQKA